MSSADSSAGATAGTPEKPLLVKAIHAYRPVNNDELKLEKHDIITVTQKEDGGWWEGTLNGRTGWFPANYITEYDPSTLLTTNPTSLEASPTTLTSLAGGSSPLKMAGTTASSPNLGGTHVGLGTSSGPGAKRSQLTSTPIMSTSALLAPTEEQLQYRRMVLNDLTSSETTLIEDMQGLWDTHLQNLSKSGILTPSEFKVLVGNFQELIQCHRTYILNSVRAETVKAAKEQRIGKIFLDNAPKLESIHKVYCENHPKAVQVIEKYKEALGTFMETQGLGPMGQPGIITLITGLSQPFSRLEKYPTLIQELERHVEESHKDRGDLQRSIEYYKQIDKTCIAVRKQKEMELEVLSGAIEGWEGSDISSLGDIIHMNLVHIGPDCQPRYFVLFTNTLLILAYNSEKNSLAYEGKIPVSGITLTALNENERGVSHAFEIAGPMIDQILVTCSSKQVKENWLQHLNKILKTNRFPSFGYSPLQTFGHLTPPVQAWNISRLRPASPFNPFLAECLALSKNMNGKSSSSATGNGTRNGTQNIPGYGAPVPVTHEEDFLILSIVDAFCAKNRQVSTVSSSNHNSVAETGKLANAPGKPTRTLAEVVFLLREDVSSLKSNLAKVMTQLDEEQQARKALQNFVQSHIPVGSTGTD